MVPQGDAVPDMTRREDKLTRAASGIGGMVAQSRAIAFGQQVHAKGHWPLLLRPPPAPGCLLFFFGAVVVPCVVGFHLLAFDRPEIGHQLALSLRLFSPHRSGEKHDWGTALVCLSPGAFSHSAGTARAQRQLLR